MRLSRVVVKCEAKERKKRGKKKEAKSVVMDIYAFAHTSVCIIKAHFQMREEALRENVYQTHVI